MRLFLIGLGMVLGVCLIGAICESQAQDDAKSKEKPSTVADEKGTTVPKEPAGFPPPPNLVRLAKDYDIWLDQPRKQLIVDGKVVLREGLLEMFACPKQT